jgi:hypothetical protein
VAKIDLEQGEQELGSWTMNYLPPGGGRYTGKLLVTDTRLLFDAKFDTSLGGVMDQLMNQYGDHGILSIPKSDISEVKKKSSFLKKQAIVTLTDGQEHVFDYGALSVDKVIAALQG